MTPTPGQDAAFLHSRGRAPSAILKLLRQTLSPPTRSGQVRRLMRLRIELVHTISLCALGALRGETFTAEHAEIAEISNVCLPQFVLCALGDLCGEKTITAEYAEIAELLIVSYPSCSLRPRRSLRWKNAPRVGWT